MQTYFKIASDFNLDFYIQPLSILISQLSALFDSIIIVMRLLYSESEADSQWFVIYYLHYKKNPEMTKFIHNHHLVFYLTAVIRKIS